MGDPMRQCDVVFSYCTASSISSGGGEVLMWKLSHALASAGITSFNRKQVPSGSNWREWWCSEANGCKVIVALLSPSYFKSEECTAELTFVANTNRHIVPVVAEPFPPRPG